MDPHIQSLVCGRCWDTIFSTETFGAIWATAAHPASSSSYKYCSPSWAEMQLSIDSMCEWCDLVCEEIQFYYHHKTKNKDDPPPEARFQLTVKFLHKSPRALHLELMVGDWKPKWLVYTTDESPAGRHITTRDVLRKVNSPTAFNLAGQCISHCMNHHENCTLRQETFFPARVIDCSNPQHPRLRVGSEGEHSYVTLSYVWGEDQPFKTTSKNQKEYTRGIDIDQIPQTIRDAITVTHQLRQRYLWVDAFCIIQDSREDKAEQISHMRDIFHRAYVTIIAACASKASDGFLHDRRPGFPTPSTLPFPTPDGALGTMFLSRGCDVRPEPVDSRAWCLEERVLSPRSLVYCSHTLQYECQTEHMNVKRAADAQDVREDIVQLPSWIFQDRLISASPAVSGIEDAERTLEKTWRKIIGCYTRRTLTKPGDRLVAMSGLAQTLHQHWPERQGVSPRYLAGLWSHHLPGCLMWTSCRAFPRPAVYRAPSWSWAAVDGEISYSIHNASNMICEVHSCQTHLAHEKHPYGEITAGVLVLCAIVRRAIWDPQSSNLFELPEVLKTASYNISEQGDDGEIGYVTIDALEPASDCVGEVFVVIIMKTAVSVEGLVMERQCTRNPSERIAATDGQKGLTIDPTIENFRRLGTFTAPFCDRDIWLSTSPQIIQII